MRHKSTDHTLAPEDMRLFRLGTPGKDPADVCFPTDSSARKAFLFQLTGYTAKPLDLRGWTLLNQSINNGFKLKLEPRDIGILSMMDEVLGEVPRFVGMRHMAPQKTDSTAAHTKQVMNIIQQVYEQAKVPPTPSQEQFRRDALVGAWLHDMGEVVMELSTASQFFAMSPEAQKRFSEEKDAVEREVVRFSLDLAGQGFDRGDTTLFARTMRSLRAELVAVPNSPNLPEDRAKLLAKRLGELRETLGLGEGSSPSTEQMLDLYDRTENPEKGTFLHPFVKTLECVEGQRYLQRNGGDAAHLPLYRQLHPQAMAAQMGMHLISDHEMVEACRRSERRLPMLFERAESSDEKKLAREAAKFTYHSIARQFLPKKEDHVAELPAIIDRSPQRPNSKDDTLTVSELETIRDQENRFKQDALSKQGDDINGRYVTRERAGHIYRAAQEAVANGRFRPSKGALLALADTPALTDTIATYLRSTEGSPTVRPLRSPADETPKSQGR